MGDRYDGHRWVTPGGAGCLVIRDTPAHPITPEIRGRSARAS